MANHRPDRETMGKSAFLDVIGGGGEACSKEISLETSRSWRLQRPGGCRFLVSRVLFRQKGSSLFFLKAGGEIPKRKVSTLINRILSRLVTQARGWQRPLQGFLDPFIELGSLRSFAPISLHMFIPSPLPTPVAKEETDLGGERK